MILLLSSIVGIIITFCSILVITMLLRSIRLMLVFHYAIVTVVRINFISLIFDSFVFIIKFYVLIICISL